MTHRTGPQMKNKKASRAKAQCSRPFLCPSAAFSDLRTLAAERREIEKSAFVIVNAKEKKLERTNWRLLRHSYRQERTRFQESEKEGSWEEGQRR